MERKFYKTLLEWKEKYIETPLMVVGARQIGKTYIIEEFCKNEFEDYIIINLMGSPSITKIFEEEINFTEKVEKIELELKRKINPEKTVIFIDEIQESEKAITALKFFAESPLPYKIICAGSLLGVKIHRFKSSFPVGKVRIEFMRPMDFEEFLLALDNKMWVDEIKKCYKGMKPISIHDQLMKLYRTYLCVGGMPEAIKKYKQANQDILLWDKSIVSNIIMSYLADMNKYTLTPTESIKIEKVYKAIPIALSKENKKFMYADIEPKAEKKIFETAIDWLLASNMINRCTAVNNIEKPLKAFSQEHIFKLYYNDVGMLTYSLGLDYADILLDKSFITKGALAETYIAQEFTANNIDLYYWNPDTKAEVDFVLSNKDGIIPVEVKSSDNKKSQSLKVYVKKYNPPYSIRVSAKNFGFKNNIKSIPLYAVFCIGAEKSEKTQSIGAENP
ncbi:MAG: DUF4143 domain-containing protein [Lachnospiraceae bacterium]|nr:DUF4143 domain-containing protein [Lachnospiraceae bacterium]